MKRENKKRKGFIVFMTILLCFCMSVSIQAAALSKTKQKQLYYNLIKSGTAKAKTSGGRSVKYRVDAFLMLDVNKDGTYELFTTDYSYNKKWQVVNNNVFTINKKGKVIYVDSFCNSTELHGTAKKIYYNTSKKGIVAEAYVYHGKCNVLKVYGGPGKEYFSSEDVMYVGNKPKKSLTTNIKAYSYRGNTEKNRKKYLK